MEYKEITEKIIGSAYKVYNKMGYVYLESVYEKCLIIELKEAGLKVEVQKPNEPPPSKLGGIVKLKFIITKK
jgi:hypothetical protein